MSGNITDKLRRIEFLPTFPHIVGEVMSVIEDPKSSASDLVRHMDPSLVGEVMKVANSAYFGRRNFRRILTIEHAVAAIGYTALSSIVLQMPFLSMIKTDDPLFDRKGFMRHSLSSGILAKTISSVFEMGNPNTVYVSAMLHDVGIIIIYQYFKEESVKINDLMENDGLSRLEAEKAVLFIDHAGIGSALLELWDIPGEIVESVRLHHSREEIGEKENPYVTWLANGLAKQIDFEKDLTDFHAFFEKQRDMLQSEMPEKYLLSHHLEQFETAHSQLRELEEFLEHDEGEE